MDCNGSDPLLLGDLIRHHRRASGLTQLQLASRAGVSAGAIRDLEQGRTAHPLPGSLDRLASALELRPAQIGELQRAPVAGGVLVQVLGPLAVWRDGARLRLAGAARRAVLGLLALSPGRLVHRDAVIDALWPDHPPASAVSLVQIHVSRLRRLIEPGRAAGSGAGLLVSAGDSYRLTPSAGELDLLALGELTADARAAHAAGDDTAACGLYEQVLGLWRGEPLADVELLHSHPGVIRLSRQRGEAVTEYAKVASSAGWHDRVLGLLRELAAREPLNEQAHAQLMIALAGSGQQAEALAHYRDLCRRLDDELAMPPSAELAEAHQRVLRQEIPHPQAAPAMISRPADDRASGRSWVVPRQLPAAPTVFVGREAELNELSALAGEARAGGAVVISAVGGSAGVGKTALAVHWAHQAAAQFPDGQLYVNLRGFDPSARAVSATEALGWFLEALGVAPQRMPVSLEARGGLFRSLVAARRLLIVLDNASDVGQVRPLLPGSPGCLVLVTSRTQLSGLAVSEGALLLSLDVLTVPEAHRMLMTRLGAGQAADEQAAISEIAALCARLPLALAITAGRAAARPRLSLGELAAELRGAAGLLEVLDGGDPATNVRAVLSWSYDQLSPAAARMFRLLGIHPGPDITVAAAASLSGVSADAARQALGELTDASLLAEHAADRYAFHDLLRAYAAEQAHATDDAQARHEAIGRMLDHYLHTGHAAVLLISPARVPISLDAPRQGVTPERLASVEQALGWLQAEYQVLLGAVSLAGVTGFGAHAWQIPWTMADFLDRRGQWQEEAALQRAAVAAALRLGDTAGQAASLRLLARTCERLGDYDDALTHYAACLTLYQQLGDREGEAKVHHLLGVVAERQNRHADALSHAQQALSLYEAIGHRQGQASMLNNIGWVHGTLGDYQQARAFCRRSLALAADLGMRHNEACAWDSLGYAEHHLGNLAEAAACYERALGIFREFGDRLNEAEILTHLGDSRCAAGELAAAENAWRQALDILDDIGHPLAGAVRVKLSDQPAKAHHARAAVVSKS